MRNFKRGQIFLARLPDTKFERRLVPPSPLLNGERYVVVLHDSDNQNFDERQVLVAPIIPMNEEIPKGAICFTYIKLLKSDFSFLDEDSLASTNQILPINRDWLDELPVDDIANKELSYRIDLGIIRATSLSSLIEAFVEEESNILEIAYVKPKFTPSSFTNTSTRNFKRGDVFYSQLPEQIYSYGTFAPSFTIQGEHMVVVLHNSDDINFDQSQVLVTPITSASAAVREGKLLATHLELLPEDFSFLKSKSFVSTHQIMPINREWLDRFSKGDITPKMIEVDLRIVLACDILISVNKLVSERISELKEGSSE